MKSYWHPEIATSAQRKAKKRSLRNQGRINRIERDLAGRLTEEQRSKLLEIAQRCPVYRTLVFEIDIRPACPVGESPDALPWFFFGST